MDAVARRQQQGHGVGSVEGILCVQRSPRTSLCFAAAGRDCGAEMRQLNLSTVNATKKQVLRSMVVECLRVVSSAAISTAEIRQAFYPAAGNK